jgi:hypothetical protein
MTLPLTPASRRHQLLHAVCVEIASRFVGWGVGNSLIEAYRVNARSYANSAANGMQYLSTDIVWVLADGEREGRISVFNLMYTNELDAIIAAKATVISDPKSIWNEHSIGQVELHKFMTEHGYTYSEKIIKGQAVAFYSFKEKTMKEKLMDRIQLILGEVSKVDTDAKSEKAGHVQVGAEVFMKENFEFGYHKGENIINKFTSIPYPKNSGYDFFGVKIKSLALEIPTKRVLGGEHSDISAANSIAQMFFSAAMFKKSDQELADKLGVTGMNREEIILNWIDGTAGIYNSDRDTVTIQKPERWTEQQLALFAEKALAFCAGQKYLSHINVAKVISAHPGNIWGNVNMTNDGKTYVHILYMDERTSLKGWAEFSEKVLGIPFIAEGAEGRDAYWKKAMSVFIRAGKEFMSTPVAPSVALPGQYVDSYVVKYARLLVLPSMTVKSTKSDRKGTIGDGNFVVRESFIVPWQIGLARGIPMKFVPGKGLVLDDTFGFFYLKGRFHAMMECEDRLYNPYTNEEILDQNIDGVTSIDNVKYSTSTVKPGDIITVAMTISKNEDVEDREGYNLNVSSLILGKWEENSYQRLWNRFGTGVKKAAEFFAEPDKKFAETFNEIISGVATPEDKFSLTRLMSKYHLGMETSNERKEIALKYMDKLKSVNVPEAKYLKVIFADSWMGTAIQPGQVLVEESVTENAKYKIDTSVMVLRNPVTSYQSFMQMKIVGIAKNVPHNMIVMHPLDATYIQADGDDKVLMTTWIKSTFDPASDEAPFVARDIKDRGFVGFSKMELYFKGAVAQTSIGGAFNMMLMAVGWAIDNKPELLPKIYSIFGAALDIFAQGIKKNYEMPSLLKLEDSLYDITGLTMGDIIVDKEKKTATLATSSTGYDLEKKTAGISEIFGIALPTELPTNDKFQNIGNKVEAARKIVIDRYIHIGYQQYLEGRMTSVHFERGLRIISLLSLGGKKTADVIAKFMEVTAGNIEDVNSRLGNLCHLVDAIGNNRGFNKSANVYSFWTKFSPLPEVTRGEEVVKKTIYDFVREYATSKEDATADRMIAFFNAYAYAGVQVRGLYHTFMQRIAGDEKSNFRGIKTHCNMLEAIDGMFLLCAEESTLPENPDPSGKDVAVTDVASTPVSQQNATSDVAFAMPKVEVCDLDASGRYFSAENLIKLNKNSHSHLEVLAHELGHALAINVQKTKYANGTFAQEQQASAIALYMLRKIGTISEENIQKIKKLYIETLNNSKTYNRNVRIEGSPTPTVPAATAWVDAHVEVIATFLKVEVTKAKEVRDSK